jgi:hypothetical protein
MADWAMLDYLCED